METMPWSAFIQVFEKRVFRVTRNDQVRLQPLEAQLTGDAFFMDQFWMVCQITIL